MKTLWQKILAFLKDIFGVGQEIPADVANSDATISKYWDIYACRAPWLPYSYVTADGKNNRASRRSLNPAKIVCSEMAGLVLNELPDVDAGDLVAAVLDAEDFFPSMRRRLEYQGALGGQALKLFIEDGKIRLDYVMAQNLIPLKWDNKRIVEASFLDRRSVKGKSYIRVETHKQIPGGYRITSNAYSEETSKEVGLDIAWPKTSASLDLKINQPLFAYIANPEANNIDPESPLGLSMLANCEDTLQALDISFDEFVWEVEGGARRIAIPGSCMRRYLDPDTGTYKQGFNPGDRVFMRLEGDDAEKFKPTDLTFDIRVQQFVDSINAQFKILAVQTGFDAGYFSFDGVSTKTATEVISENSHTYKTMMAFRENLRAGMIQLFSAINELGRLYQIEGATDKMPTVNFADGIIEDTQTKIARHTALYGAGLESLPAALMAIHGIDEEKANAMAEAIKKDKATITSNSLFGIGG